MTVTADWQTCRDAVAGQPVAVAASAAASPA